MFVSKKNLIESIRSIEYNERGVFTHFWRKTHGIFDISRMRRKMECIPAMKEKYQGPYQTEWELMKDVLLKEGVPEEVILREDGATFTYQNAINSIKVTDAVGIRVKKAIICCKAQHARRCKLYYQYLYPQTTFLICPSDVGINRENWFDTQKGRKEVLGEVEKCGEQLQRIFCREADSWSI